MANQLYGQRGLSGNYPTTTSRSSTIDDNNTFVSDSDPSLSLLGSSRYKSSFSDHHLSLSSDPSPSSTYFSSLADRTLRHSSASTGLLWPSSYDAASRSFDAGSAFSKRPSEAIYGQSILGAHMVGQSEAWLTSDSLTKRPRLESASHLPIYPQRPGEKDCVHYMLTRTCKFGETCKFDHPIWVPEGGIPDWKEPPSVPYDSHPERPGVPDCPYFLKTQKCKFGLNCKFNHPKDILDASGKTGALDLPERPSEPPCSFYMKTGKCKFGVSCKFHHPKDIQIPSTGQETGKAEQPSSIEKAGTSTVADVNAVIVPTVSPAPSYNYKGLPMRPGEADCPFYMKTGSCKYGANCRYNHPERNAINPPVAAIGHTIVTSPVARLNTALVNPFASVFQDFHPRPAQAMFGLAPPIYPQRPGETECEYYIKTGECKFGERCKFHHDLERLGPTKKQTQEPNVKLTLAGLPRREGVLHCPFYMKTGTCGYGATCRFDHPPPGEVMAALAAGKETSAPTEKEEREDGDMVTAKEDKQSPKEG